MDIFPDHRKYLAFSWDFGDGHTVLPVGLSGAPFRFLPSCKNHWKLIGNHKASIPIAIFSDDGVGAGSSLEAAKLTVFS